MSEELFTAAQLNQAVAEAQSATIEAAVQHRFSIGSVTVGCSCGWYVDSMSSDCAKLWEEHLRSVLSTEAIDAAQAARDKRIRAEGKLAEAEWWNQNHGSQHDGNWKLCARRRLTELRAAARKETP